MKNLKILLELIPNFERVWLSKDNLYTHSSRLD